MNKKCCILSIVFLLSVCVSSSTAPARSSDITRHDNLLNEVMSSAEVLKIDITERVTLNPDGTCDIGLLMTMPASQLAGVYRRIFNFTEGSIELEKDIPESVVFEDEITVDPNSDPSIEYTPYEIDPVPVPIRTPFLKGIIEEHWYSFGINITQENISRASTWGTTLLNCLVAINATGTLQLVEPGRITIGPLYANNSINRAGFIFNKFGMIQQMLDSFEGEQEYVCDWTTNFVGGNASNVALEDWFEDFGNGTSLNAHLVATGVDVTLIETMQVAEKLVSVEPEELFEDGFLNYKVFDILITQNVGGMASNGQIVHAGKARLKQTCGLDGSLDPDWSWTIVNEKVKWKIMPDQVNLAVHTVLTLSGGVDWAWGWDLKLKRFQAWVRLDATVNATLDIDSLTNEWSKTLIERSRQFWFTVGIIPVELSVKGAVTAYLKFDAQVHNISFCVEANGWMKAGIRWTKYAKWSPIRETDADFTMKKQPSINQNWEVTIKSSLGFRFTLLFYETVGPYVEFEPYAALTIYGTDESTQWETELGIDVSAGVEFGKWLKDLIGLKDWSWPIINYILWRYSQQPPPPPEHDVAVTEVTAPDAAFVTEYLDVFVTVVNLGSKDEGSVNVTLVIYDHDHNVVRRFVAFPVNMMSGESARFGFGWDTSNPIIPRDHATYEIKLIASVSYDEDGSNDWQSTSIDLHVQDAWIKTAKWNPTIVDEDQRFVIAGQNVEVEVEVVNQGSVNLSTYVTAYYTEYLTIGTLTVSDLAPHSSISLLFIWNTTNVSLGQYEITARTPILEYEFDCTDNSQPAWNNPCRLIGAPFNYNVCVQVTQISLTKSCVDKGKTTYVTVTVANGGNSGNYNETFYLTVYANTAIRVQTQVVTLANGTFADFTFSWNTAGREEIGAYTISAYAWPIPGDNNTADNMLIDGVVVVTILGDVDGNFVVNILDVVKITGTYASRLGDPNFNYNSDINDDGEITILDVVLCTGHYGQEWSL